MISSNEEYRRPFFLTYKSAHGRLCNKTWFTADIYCTSIEDLWRTADGASQNMTTPMAFWEAVHHDTEDKTLSKRLLDGGQSQATTINAEESLQRLSRLDTFRALHIRSMKHRHISAEEGQERGRGRPSEPQYDKTALAQSWVERSPSADGAAKDIRRKKTQRVIRIYFSKRLRAATLPMVTERMVKEKITRCVFFLLIFFAVPSDEGLLSTHDWTIHPFVLYSTCSLGNSCWWSKHPILVVVNALKAKNTNNTAEENIGMPHSSKHNLTSRWAAKYRSTLQTCCWTFVRRKCTSQSKANNNGE